MMKEMFPRKIEHAVVTGASGMLGVTLVRLLLSKGIRVTAVVRKDSENNRNLPEQAEGLTLAYCDITALRTLQADPIDAWFHFAWSGTYGEARNDEARQAENVRYTLDAAARARELGAKVFVFAGSQAEYGKVTGTLTEDTPMHPLTAYGKAKKCAEEELLKAYSGSGMDIVLTRILSVYGPYDHDYTMIMSAVRALIQKEHISFTKGEQIWDYLYAEDAAECFFRLSQSGRENEAYVLGSGTHAPLRDYILKLKNAVDPEAEIGLGERPYPAGQVMYLAADITKLTRDTGYVPETDFETGIARTAAYARERIRHEEDQHRGSVL